MATIVQVNDSLINRNRPFRTMVFFLSPVLLVTLGGLLFGALALIFLGKGPFFAIGSVIGAVAGFIAFLASKHLFVVENDTTGLLVTLDQLKSLFGMKNVNVVYGPGTHFSYPWEVRFAKNNIPVTEAAEEFNITAICADGTLTGPVSFRLRPDFTNPINYLSGVGAVAGDFKDLIVSFITEWLATKTTKEALEGKAELNKALHDKFVGNDRTPFEERFGILVSDVTVGALLMSDDAQKTRTAINEARVIAEGTAILLGYETAELMKQALSAKVITQADVDHARREFRIISGNMDNAEVKRFEVDIAGLSPEIASAVTAFLSNPATRSIMSNMQGSNKQAGNKQPRKGAPK